MANNDDFGYFGKGAEGYAHYMQTFERTQNASSGGRCKPKDFGESRQTIKNDSDNKQNQPPEISGMMMIKLKLLVWALIIGALAAVWLVVKIITVILYG